MDLIVFSHLEPILCVVNGAIYLIGRYNFIVYRPSCYVINQQQLQCAAYMVPRVASTYHRSYYSNGLLNTLAHTESNLHTTFILF